MQRWLVLSSSLALLACKPTASPPSPEVTVPTAPAASNSALPVGSSLSHAPETPPPTTDLRVIVAADKAADFYWRAAPATKFFTPSEADVAKLEEKLPAFLRAKAPASRFGQPPLADRAPKYMRQYVGHIDPNGKRWIWANFFCRYYGADGDTDGWKRRGFGVKDGGDCYFNVEFSVDSGEWRDLGINGDA